MDQGFRKVKPGKEIEAMLKDNNIHLFGVELVRNLPIYSSLPWYRKFWFFVLSIFRPNKVRYLLGADEIVSDQPMTKQVDFLFEWEHEVGGQGMDCCVEHGCIYGDDDNCPVVNKGVVQSHTCM